MAYVGSRRPKSKAELAGRKTMLAADLLQDALAGGFHAPDYIPARLFMQIYVDFNPG